MDVNGVLGPAQADPRSSEFVERFSAFLKSQGYVDELGLRRAQRAQGQSGERFDLVVMRLGLLADEAMAKALSVFCGIPVLQPHEVPAAAVLSGQLDRDFLKTNKMLPVSDAGTNVVLAVADPFNADGIAAIAYLIDRPVELRVASDGTIQRALDGLYGARETRAANVAAADDGTASADDVRRLEDLASEAPVIRLVQDLLARAAGEQASDIHIEPREDCVRVRLRVDGFLHTIETLPLSMRAAIGSRIKIMARLNIAERRLPQDGRIVANVRGREIDLRVSTMPTMWGESIVLRLLDRSSVELDFAKLGFAGQSYQELSRLLHEPNGILLVTGPTGSGKTTTLYAALSELNAAEHKLFTVEDPIEYQLPGVNQIQVQPRIGLTFAHALRSILRQDPDIIMVGEIRDLETAQIAIQAALTGHLVLSTVHTNSAAATLTRLIDMGVERYLLASTIKGVLAQRLVRKLCASCAAPSPDAENILALLKATGADAGDLLGGRDPLLRRACGCPSCRNTGFAGRTTIYELLTMTPTVAGAVMGDASEADIQKIATAQGMTTMLQAGLAKALTGETTTDEVMRVARFDP